MSSSWKHPKQKLLVALSLSQPMGRAICKRISFITHRFNFHIIKYQFLIIKLCFVLMFIAGKCITGFEICAIVTLVR